MAIGMENYNISSDSGQEKNWMAVIVENYNISSETGQDKTEWQPV